MSLLRHNTGSKGGIFSSESSHSGSLCHPGYSLIALQRPYFPCKGKA